MTTLRKQKGLSTRFARKCSSPSLNEAVQQNVESRLNLSQSGSDHYVTDVLRPLAGASDGSVFAMFKGFMDESGIGDSDLACTVAGFAGGELTCNKAEDLWKKLVQPIGCFHAEEFFARHDGKMTEFYKSISVADAEACVMRLIDMLKSSGLEPIGMAINANIFRTLSDDEKRYMASPDLYGKTWDQQPKHPYFPCFHYCVTQANQFTPEGEKIYLTFDRQALYAEKARQIFNKFKDDLGGKWGERLGGVVAFASKQDSVLLQAADLLAYSIGQLLNTAKRNAVVQSVLDTLAINKEYIRAMDVKAIDEHLKKCPFRTTFWKDMSDPDLIESIASQGFKTVTYKTPEGYLTHHIRPNRLTVLGELRPQLTDGLNRTDRRSDST